MTDDRTTWRFPATFWIANVTELFERAAYYGTFIAARTYLIRVVGLDEVQAGVVAGLFGALISIFYMIVNIGSFTGKTVVAPIRIELGVQHVPWFSAVASLVALVVTVLLFRPDENRVAQPRSMKETFQGMLTVMGNMRFLALILITAGFWAIQGQLWALPT